MYEKCLRVSSLVKGKHLPAPPSGREWAKSYTANVERNRMIPVIRILTLPRDNGLLGGRMSGQRSEQLFVLRMGNYPRKRMNHKLAIGMKMWKANGYTTTLLFSLKRLEIVHLERRGQVKTASSSTSPDLLTSNIPTNQPTNQPTSRDIKASHKLNVLEINTK